MTRGAGMGHLLSEGTDQAAVTLGHPTTYYLCDLGKSLAPQRGSFPICNKWITTDLPFVELLC